MVAPNPEDAVPAARRLLSPCRVCPRRCGADRSGGKAGFCGIGVTPRIASAGAHFGEEDVLVGSGGSGAIFFQGCNLRCVFCQNYDISANPAGGTEAAPDQISRIMLRLQRSGCGNINLVTPTHVAPQCLEAIALARRDGLKLPVVYNCGGYESVEMLRLLEGAVEIYMPDFKYASAEPGRKYSAAEDYPTVARAALAEMYRQVGPLQVNADGLARRGVMVRHLVLPMDLAQSRKVLDLVAETAPGCGLNVMGQYRPCYRAGEFPELLLQPAGKEIARLREYAARLGLRRLD